MKKFLLAIALLGLVLLPACVGHAGHEDMDCCEAAAAKGEACAECSADGAAEMKQCCKDAAALGKECAACAEKE
jgi:hypothetical protein